MSELISYLVSQSFAQRKLEWTNGMLTNRPSKMSKSMEPNTYYCTTVATLSVVTVAEVHKICCPFPTNTEAEFMKKFREIHEKLEESNGSMELFMHKEAAKEKVEAFLRKHYVAGPRG